MIGAASATPADRARDPGAAQGDATEAGAPPAAWDIVQGVAETGGRLTAPQIARVLAALLQEDIRRDTGRSVTRAEILARDRIDEDGIGLDSLARLRAIASVTAFFGLATTGLEDYLVIDPRVSAWTRIVLRHLDLRGDEAGITFTSSGSSGLAPKAACHRLADLSTEVDAVADLLGLRPQGRHRILAAVPPHHIYGFLFTVLLPDRLGCAVLDLSERPPSASLREAGDGDLVVGTPFTWQLACDGGATSAIGAPGGCLGLVSTAPAPAELWPRTRSAGVARLFELYGSSETSGVGWRDDPAAAFALLPHLDREGDRPARGATPLHLPDRLQWSGAREFRLKGRIDEAVQVGGTNVAPAAVADALSRVPGVAEIAVRLQGDRLKAFVVPDPRAAGKTAALERRLRSAADRGLAAPARPARYSFGSTLPRSATGKLADWTDAGT